MLLVFAVKLSIGLAPLPSPEDGTDLKVYDEPALPENHLRGDGGNNRPVWLWQMQTAAGWCRVFAVM